MRDDDIDARIDALRGTGRYVSVVMAGASGHGSLGGVIEDAGDALVLVQEVRDFHRRGFVLLPRASIVAVHESEVERLFARMIAAEGVAAELRAPPHLDLDHWLGCLRDVRRLNNAISLERASEGEVMFYLGRVAGLSRDAVSLRCITVEGAVERAAVEVPFDEVSLVTFDDRYSAFFDRHATDEDLH